MKHKVFHPNWATFKRERPNLNYPEAKQENYLAKHHYCARGRRFLSSFSPSKLTSGEALYFVGRKWSINFHPLKNGNAKVFPSGLVVLVGGRRGVCFSDHFPPTPPPPWKIKQKKSMRKENVSSSPHLPSFSKRTQVQTFASTTFSFAELMMLKVCWKGKS